MWLGELTPDLESDETLQGVHLLQTNATSNEKGDQHSMVRYLKLKMRGHEMNDNGLYCTLSRLRVYGSSMHQVVRDFSLNLLDTDDQLQSWSNEVEETVALQTNPIDQKSCPEP